MKKIILAIAALALIASPALAVDWNFYGSARMATYYNSRDFNNTTNFDDLDDGGLTLTNVNNRGTDFDDDQVQWDLQGNSRLGATVKAENVSGRFEFGITDDNGGGNVSSRRIYGEWDFGAAKLKVGKDYTPVKQFISGQVFDGDAGLLGNGTAYGGRRGQIALSFGGFEVAAVTNPGNNLRNIDTGDKDIYVPRLEAAYGMSFDTWNFKLLGGFNYFSYEDAGPDDEDVDVTSWIIGADAGVNFGPAYLKGGVNYGANWGNAGWSVAGNAVASFDGDDSTKDIDTLMASLIGGFKFTDQLTFEAGVGYVNNDSDLQGEDDADIWAYYLQAVISLAPGVWIIPEAGYYDYGDDYSAAGNGRDAGNQLYVGAKWQIDF
jgi:hypothetical protein